MRTMEHSDSPTPLISVLLVLYSFFVPHPTLHSAEFAFVETTRWLAAMCAIIVSLPAVIERFKEFGTWLKEKPAYQKLIARASKWSKYFRRLK